MSNTPAVHLRLAWYSTVRKWGASSKVSSHRLIHGIALSNSFLRRSTTGSRDTDGPTASTDSRFVMVCLVSLETAAPLAKSSSAKTTKTPAKTSMRSNVIGLTPLAHFHGLFKQCRWKKDSRYAQPLQELGTNAAGRKYADHLAVRAHSFSVEGEYFLHTDD